jgi:hypothetical protein
MVDLVVRASEGRRVFRKGFNARGQVRMYDAHDVVVNVVLKVKNGDDDG